jgi:hypothetical protein
MTQAINENWAMIPILTAAAFIGPRRAPGMLTPHHPHYSAAEQVRVRGNTGRSRRVNRSNWRAAA